MVLTSLAPKTSIAQVAGSPEEITQPEHIKVEREITRGPGRIIVDQFGQEWTRRDWTLSKPSIPSDKLLDSSEREIVRNELRKRPSLSRATKEIFEGRLLIHADAIVAKNDYINDEDRGTVHFNLEKTQNFLGQEVYKMRNYMNHKVIIPDGTIVQGVNFSQKDPHTDAIQCVDCVFIDCNLMNVEIHPSWTIQGGLVAHSRKRIINDQGLNYEIHEVETSPGVWEEASRNEVP